MYGQVCKKFFNNIIILFFKIYTIKIIRGRVNFKDRIRWR